MQGLNKVMLIGNVGHQPEIRYTKDGNQIVSLSIATHEKWKERLTGESQDRTEWHRVVFFNSLANIIANHAEKGTKLFIEGKLKTRKWSHDGIDRYSTEVLASNFQFVGSKNERVGDDFHNTNKTNNSISVENSFDDDVPF